MLFYFDENDLVRLRPARQYLETLLPDLQAPVLDVGVKRYTKHFRQLIQTPYVTVDRVARRRPDLIADVLEPEFVAAAQTVQRTFQTVLFNGMIGFGIDDEAAMSAAFGHFATILANSGLLLIGWNEEFIPRAQLAVLLSQAGFKEERGIYEPPNNPEKHYFWWWRKDI